VSDGEGACEEEEDPEITHKRMKLERLEQSLHDKEAEYQQETNWMSQADALVNTLRKKVMNVKLHLHDIHKRMTELHFDERKTAKELQTLEDKHAMGDKVKEMEKEMSQLMNHSETVKQQVVELTNKKLEMRAKIEELRQAVTHIKARNQPPPTVSVQESCACALPVSQRSHCLSCY